MSTGGGGSTVFWRLRAFSELVQVGIIQSPDSVVSGRN